jgi:hypothetical protein
MAPLVDGHDAEISGEGLPLVTPRDQVNAVWRVRCQFLLPVMLDNHRRSRCNFGGYSVSSWEARTHPFENGQWAALKLPMKKLTPLIVNVMLALSSGSILSAETGNRHLLTTQWYQDGPFAQFTPHHERVGCWSTAYAQILYYHRLKPTGRVSYDCSSGQKININLDEYRFDWNQFADIVTAATPKGTVEQMAQFGQSPDQPRRVDCQDQEREYLQCGQQSSDCHSTHHGTGRGTARLFHFANLRNFGHSTVIDGIRKDGDRFMVHINFGDVVAARNRWYNLFDSIEERDDNTLRAFVTIKPLAGR